MARYRRPDVPKALLELPKTESGEKYREVVGIKQRYHELQKEQKKLQRIIPTLETRMKDMRLRGGQRDQAELDLIASRRREGQIPGELQELEEKALSAWESI